MDSVERLLRSAKPKNTPLSATDRVYLEKILATTSTLVANKTSDPMQQSPIPHTHTRKKVFWLVPATATILIAVVTAIIVWRIPTHAFAATPPMLQVSQVSQDAVTVLDSLARIAAAQPDKSTDTKLIEHVWATAVEVDAQGKPIKTSVIQPEKYVYTLTPWGVAARSRYADMPYDVNGNPVNDPSLSKSGAWLGEDTFTKEDQPPAIPPLPKHAAELPTYFAEVMPPSQDEPTSLVALNNVYTLLSTGWLNPLQESALLKYLAIVPGLELQGKSEDRLGRPVYVLRSATWHEHQQLLLVDSNSGHIAGYEVVYVGTSRDDIPSPAVISYSAWE